MTKWESFSKRSSFYYKKQQVLQQIDVIITKQGSINLAARAIDNKRKTLRVQKGKTKELISQKEI